MNTIKTFVFMDLETTGLPASQAFKTKITEISLVAVNRTHLTSAEIPRILNKLNLCFNPLKPIMPDASNISGLYNDDLEPIESFNISTFHLLKHFFEQQASPICLIAHNGYKFDFPILNYEISSLKEKLSDDILCLDSLPAFRTLLKPKENKESCCNFEEFFLDVTDSVLMDTTEEIEKSLKVSQLQQLINETTPKKQIKINIGVDTVDRQIPNTSKARRRLNFNNMEDRPKSYKLKDLYSFFTKRELSNAHQAEVDTYALMKCCGSLQEDFLDYADKNCTPLNKYRF